MYLSCYRRRAIASIITEDFEKISSDLRKAYVLGVYGRHSSVGFWSTDLPIDYTKYFVVGDIFGGNSHGFLKVSCAKQEEGEKSVLLESVWFSWILAEYFSLNESNDFIH